MSLFQLNWIRFSCYYNYYNADCLLLLFGDPTPKQILFKKCVRNHLFPFFNIIWPQFPSFPWSNQKRREASHFPGSASLVFQQGRWRVILWLLCRQQQPRRQWRLRWRLWSSWGTNWRLVSRQRRRWRCRPRSITDCCSELCNTTCWPWPLRYRWTSASVTKVVKCQRETTQPVRNIFSWSVCCPVVKLAFLFVHLFFGFLHLSSPSSEFSQVSKLRHC